MTEVSCQLQDVNYRNSCESLFPLQFHSPPLFNACLNGSLCRPSMTHPCSSYTPSLPLVRN